MITPLSTTRRKPIDRSGDRQVALVAIALAISFLAAALASLALPTGVRRGLWLPLHLALAGGASTAIAGVLPFFVAAFAAAPPTRASFRALSVICVAGGAVLVTVGVVLPVALLAVIGGALFITGICLVAAASLQPLRSSLGPRGGIVTRAYIAALAMVGTGALLATLSLAGWPPVVEAWARLRPAHAWLNLIGFVSLVIATTLIHFFPTVVGSRIVAHPSARLTVIALSAGPPVVVLGYALEVGLIVRTGAAVALVGALALVIYAARIWVKRARWTTDASWHQFAIGGLGSAMAWFLVGMAILAGRVFVVDDRPAGWTLEPVIGPLVVGWIGLAILASATHLVPAVGPGDPIAHARQRVILGRAAAARLVLANLGIAGLSVGLLFGQGQLAVVSLLLAAGAFGMTALLAARAIAIGLAGASQRGA